METSIKQYNEVIFHLVLILKMLFIDGPSRKRFHILKGELHGRS